MEGDFLQSRRQERLEQIGRYRIGERIGRGAMGVVYAARDAAMDRDVAVKVMMADLEAEPDIRLRFLREAQVAAKLAHRNIVTVLDAGEEDGRLYIVMELLRGKTLADRLKDGTLTLEQKVDLLIQACEGLAVANAAGVCHRDVKPGNLFVQQDGGLKILDFGIARLASSSMTASGFIVGTPDFMSPEQARGQEVDERSDIFSVGAVAYLMLTGRKPFAASDLPAVLHKVVSETPAPLTSSEAPDALARVVFRALEKTPDARYPHCKDFGAELQRWRRRHESESSAIAAAILKTHDAVVTLGTRERSAAERLGVLIDATPAGWIGNITAGIPPLAARGMDGLRSLTGDRATLLLVRARLDTMAAAMTARVEVFEEAGTRRDRGVSLLTAGDPRAALVELERAIELVPAAPVDQYLERCREAMALQQAQRDRQRSLLAEAQGQRQMGRLHSALALAERAVEESPGDLDAQALVASLTIEADRDAADRQRQHDRAIRKARRALALHRFDDVDGQLEVALQGHPGSAEAIAVGAELGAARRMREASDAALHDIAEQVAVARSLFAGGDRAAALARLEALAGRYPSAAAVTTELDRLRVDDRLRTEHEEACASAVRAAAAAERAWANGDADTARRLAGEALALTPDDESAIRIEILARAFLRESSERAERVGRAADHVARSRASLAQGRLDRALATAQQAADLDPAGGEAPALIAEIARRRSPQQADRLRAETERMRQGVRGLLERARQALGTGDQIQARWLAEQASVLDIGSVECKEVLATISAAETAGARGSDITVDLPLRAMDPDDTATRLTPHRAPSVATYLRRGGIVLERIRTKLLPLLARLVRRRKRRTASISEAPIRHQEP